MLGTRSPCMIAVLIVCVVAWSTDGFGQEPAEGRSTLAHVREASPETFTIEVEVDQPVHVFLPGQGRSTRVMRFTVGKDLTAIVWNASQLPQVLPARYARLSADRLRRGRQPDRAHVVGRRNPSRPEGKRGVLGVDRIPRRAGRSREAAEF